MAELTTQASMFSTGAGTTLNSDVAINDTRRKFNFGDRVAELAPQQSPFFVYLSKVGKKPTNDPVFKFLEQRHQWQRRNVDNVDPKSGVDPDGGITTLAVDCGYDKYGKLAAGQQPLFLLAGQILAMEGVNDSGGAPVICHFKITNVDLTADSSEANLTVSILAVDGDTTAANWPSAITIAADKKGQVVGSAFVEGSDSPDGWEDKIFDREGYCQIFKTGMNIFSGTSLATEYRGIKNEWQRIWSDKLMEHKMDIEHAMLFGVGNYSNDTPGNATAPTRYSWGITPYTERFGKVYSMTYASSGYDAFLDAMEDFFAPESGNSGNKLVLASRKVITYLNKLGSGSFLNNSVGSSQYALDVQNIKGAFGHQVTMVNTIFGNLHFVAEPLLRGPWENYCVAVDMKNVAYRPLSGNGINRDTYIETNVQDPGVDGRRDQIITEAGLEIQLPETHAILKWS
tara:strand:- start:335 stop:1702 length:1368 start_codon:yes stop_codon:yes gene_type:complete